MWTGVSGGGLPSAAPEKRRRLEGHPSSSGEGVQGGSMGLGVPAVPADLPQLSHGLHPQIYSEPQQPPATMHRSQPLLRPKARTAVMPSAASSMPMPGEALMLAGAAQLQVECVLGKGSFGTVYKAREIGTGQSVAVKTCRKNDFTSAREKHCLQVLRGSPNVVAMLGFFLGTEDRDEERTLHLILEFVPDTLQRIIKHFRHTAQWMDISHVRLYTYQLLRGLACLSRHGIVHRDIKPANLLVDPATFILKVCDFGTAKLQEAREAAQPYVCSRYYRAPELILSVDDYAEAVDLWSVGCVLAEMLLGQPLFAGKDGVDQLHQIIEILGTPTPGELYALNPQYDAAVSFGPRIEPLPWVRVLGHRRVGFEVLELVGRLLQFSPAKRPSAIEAMASTFFDELRRGAWGGGRQLPMDPSLLVLTQEELAACPPGIRERLVPSLEGGSDGGGSGSGSNGLA